MGAANESSLVLFRIEERKIEEEGYRGRIRGRGDDKKENNKRLE